MEVDGETRIVDRIVMCRDPDSIGLPDLGGDAWLPFWDAETSFNMFGRAAWPSIGLTRRLALGSAALFVENSQSSRT